MRKREKNVKIASWVRRQNVRKGTAEQFLLCICQIIILVGIPCAVMTILNFRNFVAMAQSPEDIAYFLSFDNETRRDVIDTMGDMNDLLARIERDEKNRANQIAGGELFSSSSDVVKIAEQEIFVVGNTLPMAGKRPLVAPRLKKSVVVAGVSVIALPLQKQKDITARVCLNAANRYASQFDMSHGLFASMCYYDLLAIAYKESLFDCSAHGDVTLGHSYGCFQINGQHNLSIALREDYEFAATWTIDRLVRYGYPEARTYAIRRHNGFVDNPAQPFYQSNSTYPVAVKAYAAAFEKARL